LRDAQLKDVVKTFCDNGTETVIAVHGETPGISRQWVTEELGVKSFAPANNEIIYI